MSMSIFDQGAGAAKEAAEASGGNFVRDWDWFDLEDGNSAFLRFLSDAFVDPRYPHVGGWISVMQHNSILTCPRPEWHKTGERTKDKKWPARMKCVCRNTQVGPEGAKRPLHLLLPDAEEYQGCYVCDNRRSEKGGALTGSGRTWALAVVREQVPLEGGGVTYVTKTVEVEDEQGNKVQKPLTVVVNQAYSNFFKQLEGEATGRGTNTVLDRDFKITRVGEKLNTDYIIVGMDQVGWIDPNTQQQVILDLRIPEHFAAFDTGVKLDEIVADQASVSWQRRWFDESYVPPAKDDESSGSSQGGAPAEQQAKPGGDLDAAAVAAMAGRLTGYGAPAGGQPQSQAAVPPQAAPPAAGPIPQQAVPLPATGVVPGAPIG